MNNNQRAAKPNTKVTANSYIKTVLKEAIQQLISKKIDFPHLEAEILLSHIIKKPREFILSHPEKKLTNKQLSTFNFQLSTRFKGVPMAYILGEKEFYGLRFLVNKNVLVPRPETELMVEEALALAKQANEKIDFIDIGTGSGCIIISLAKTIFNFQFSIFKQFPISQFKYTGIDISKNALAVAKKNAKLNGVQKNIKFINGDLLAPLIPKLKIENCKLKIICANLPYLTPAQIKSSPSIKKEPRLALVAGNDGLKYYRQLFKQLSRNKVTNYYLLCEIDPSQKTSMRRLANKLLPNANFKLLKDLKCHNRLAVISEQ